MKVVKQSPARANKKLAVQFLAGAEPDSWRVRVKTVALQSLACADVVVASYLDHLARQPRLIEHRLVLAVPGPV